MGALFLAGYVLLIGIATFLLKVGLKDLNPYQLNILMALGMLLIGLPALWLQQKNFSLASKQLPLGILVGLMMAAGSLLFILALNKLPAGLTSAIAGTYVVIVVVLSWLVLHESLDVLKAAGILLTISGVALLSLKA